MVNMGIQGNRVRYVVKPHHKIGGMQSTGPCSLLCTQIVPEVRPEGQKIWGMTCNASILHHKSRKLNSNCILKVNMWKQTPTRIRSSKVSDSQVVSESNVVLKLKKISTSKNLRKERTCGRGPNTNSSIWHAVSRSRVFCRGSKRKRKHQLVWGSTETYMPREILYCSKLST